MGIIGQLETISSTPGHFLRFNNKGCPVRFETRGSGQGSLDQLSGKDFSVSELPNRTQILGIYRPG